MTSTEWIRTLKRLIIMYREVYYQERMADELRKDASQIKLEALPDNLPSITKIEKDVADSEHNKNQSWGCMGIALVFMLLAIALSNGFLIVIGVFAIFVALLIVTAASDEQKKAKGHLEWETNEQRKKTDEIFKSSAAVQRICRGLLVVSVTLHKKVSDIRRRRSTAGCRNKKRCIRS